jgi:serine/threonine protein kinase
MTIHHSAYAIFFNEGPGYLFVANLGRGLCGKVMLVRSCAYPHNLYVRKRVLNLESRSDCELYHNEIYHYPLFKFVPELLDWTDYGFMSYSMTTKFCNGGSLGDLLFNTLSNDRRPIPEIFVWKIFTQVLETLEYLHHQRGVAHLDLVAQNVFLHWPEESLTESVDSNVHLPDFYLGDFGFADKGWAHNVLSDLRLLHSLVIGVCLGSSRNPLSLQGWKDRFPSCYSKELKYCLGILPEPWDHRGPNKCLEGIIETNIVRALIMPTARQKMAELERKGSKVDYRFTKPSTKTEVEVNKKKGQFNCHEIDEPFFYARVDEKTLDVIEVETKPNPIAPGHCGYGCVFIRPNK